MSKYILSIDAGTTGITLLLFDKEANIVEKEYSEFSQIYPEPGYVEHDPIEIWNITLQLMNKIIHKYPEQIHSIGITNQRETVVVWDKSNGQPIYNAIVWQCKRTLPECSKLISNNYENIIKEKTGLVVDSYFSATKIQWIIKNIKKSKKLLNNKKLLFGTIDTWLIWKLTGGKNHVTDHTNASRTMLYNINSFSWDKELLELFKINQSMLPKINNSSSYFGTTDINILKESIPITGTAGDQQAALFGQYGFNAHDVKCTYGTGCFMLINTGNNRINSNHGMLTTIACNKTGHPIYALEGSVFIGGAVIQWLRDELKLISSAHETEKIANSIKNTDGVYIVPAFTGLGAPYWNMESRGIITGLTRGSNRKHIIRASLESIAFQVNDLITCLNKDVNNKLRVLRVDGGATKNHFLMQFQANVSNIEIEKPDNIETTALGAALLSGIGSNYWDNIENLLKKRKIVKKYSPKIKDVDRIKILKDWSKAVKRSL